MQQGCAVILAAGTASRMGTAKQLLSLQGYPMLEHVIRLVLKADFAQVITVIGHEAERIQHAISIPDPRFQWMVNPAYMLGQSTSFKAGMERALDLHTSVVVFLGDQPFIKSETVQRLWEMGQKNMGERREPFVIQPTYREKPGHPVWFGNVYEGQFDQVEGDQGAKTVLASMKRIFLPVDDPGIHLDIDTREDFEQAEHIS
ncbi:nucleotidyltransferase family protein [Brevibacillus reuszeri]|uniref:nucleotidyltransferase family protein n=1 Tax=Brevibacillus reuszeri TaxID=54915 RepID=UPI00289AD90A|nr:nucleotidyltransferase family protein [Brevibacillus reuszeri]